MTWNRRYAGAIPAPRSAVAIKPYNIAPSTTIRLTSAPAQNVWAAPGRDLDDTECLELVKAWQRSKKAEKAASSAMAAYEAAYQVLQQQPCQPSATVRARVRGGHLIRMCCTDGPCRDCCQAALNAAGSDDESDETDDSEGADVAEEVGELEDMAFEETLQWVADREVAYRTLLRSEGSGG